MPGEAPAMEFDAFLSHASEDKESVARPLYEALSELGYKIWFDEAVLRIGESVRKSIDTGLTRSNFGIVILSPAFFRKGWTDYELTSLVHLELSSPAKRILPLWHGVSYKDVLAYSPALADKVAIKYQTIGEAASLIAAEINPMDRLCLQYGPPCEWCGGATRPVYSYAEHIEELESMNEEVGDEDCRDPLKIEEYLADYPGIWLCSECGWDSGNH